MCDFCGALEHFYQTDQPTRTATQDGVWVYVPHAPDSPDGESQASSRSNRSARSRRARARRARHEGAPEDPQGEDHEHPPSEVPTNVPIVDPDTLRPVPPHPARPARQTAAQNAVQASPPSQRSPTRMMVAFLAPSSSLSTPRTTRTPLIGIPRKGAKVSGVKWKTGQIPAPPTWRYDKDDLRAFHKYKKKVDIWRLQAQQYAPGKELALLLYTSLSGECEQELIYQESGTDLILEQLRGPMEAKEIFQKRKFLTDFETIARFPGEHLRQFAHRYLEVGAEPSISRDQRGWYVRLRIPWQQVSGSQQVARGPAAPHLGRGPSVLGIRHLRGHGFAAP